MAVLPAPNSPLGGTFDLFISLLNISSIRQKMKQPCMQAKRKLSIIQWLNGPIDK
jgi:hypothetical protein